MLTLHHLENSRSHRIVWLLEEMEVEYELVAYKRNPKTMRAPDELGLVHKLGKAPIVVLDDGRVMAESGAIIEELVDTYKPELRPEPGSDALHLYRFFLHFAEGSLAPPLLVKLLTSKVREAPLPFLVKPIAGKIMDKLDESYTDPQLSTMLAFLEQELKGREFVTGDRFTAADVQMHFPMRAALARVGSGYSRIRDLVARLESRDAHKRAIARGGELKLV